MFLFSLKTFNRWSVSPLTNYLTYVPCCDLLLNTEEKNLYILLLQLYMLFKKPSYGETIKKQSHIVVAGCFQKQQVGVSLPRERFLWMLMMKDLLWKVVVLMLPTQVIRKGYAGWAVRRDLDLFDLTGSVFTDLRLATIYAWTSDKSTMDTTAEY